MGGAECIAALERLGFVVVRQRGSHVVPRRQDRGCVVPLHRELKVGTLRGIPKQAGVARKRSPSPHFSPPGPIDPQGRAVSAEQRHSGETHKLAEGGCGEAVVGLQHAAGGAEHAPFLVPRFAAAEGAEDIGRFLAVDAVEVEEGGVELVDQFGPLAGVPLVDGRIEPRRSPSLVGFPPAGLACFGPGRL